MAGDTSLPIEVTVDVSPASDLVVTLTVDTQYTYDSAQTVNADSLITINPSNVTFEAWDESMTFEVLVDSTWDLALSTNFYVNLGVSGTDATAFKLYSSTAQIDITVLDSSTAYYDDITAYDFSGSNIDSYSVDNLMVSTNGTGTLLWVVLPRGRDAPTSAEIQAYYDGTYEYVEDDDENSTRLLQETNASDISSSIEIESSSSSVEEEDEDDFSDSTAEDHADYLEEGYATGSKNVYSSGNWYFNADGLWAGDEYDVYAVLKRNDDTYGAVWSNTMVTAHTYAFMTLTAPTDEPMGVVVTGDKPQGSTLDSIADSLAETMGFPAS